MNSKLGERRDDVVVNIMTCSEKLERQGFADRYWIEYKYTYYNNEHIWDTASNSELERTTGLELEFVFHPTKN